VAKRIIKRMITGRRQVRRIRGWKEEEGRRRVRRWQMGREIRLV
jgi:hypothetical protein